MDKPLKLNYKRTLIIGFAFFGILMLWQVYNTYCPVILTELLTPLMKASDESEVQWVVGIIMALDNIFALFMLPIFGSLSDKTHTKLGKRMPYIIVGTILAAIALPFIPVMFYYNSLAGVISMMALVLIFMMAYRNPAVALMPDITPKPLRSKANGLINLVGYVGAIIAGAIALFITTTSYIKHDGAHYKDFGMYLPFIIASALMVITMIILATTIKENQILEETREDMARGEAMSELSEPVKEGERLSKNNKRSLILMIVAIFLWFAAFNAVETFWSNYSTYYIGFDGYSMAIIVLTVASLITFIPAGFLADKIGRKWTVLIGIAIMIVALFASFVISPIILGDAGYVSNTKALGFAYYGLFGVAGIGWAMINCCSYPMIVEFADSTNVGKYTGLYYTFSMIAQSLTPVALGALMKGVKGVAWAMMFPYSTVLLIAAFVVFFFVNNVKNSKIGSKKGLDAFDQD